MRDRLLLFRERAKISWDTDRVAGNLFLNQYFVKKVMNRIKVHGNFRWLLT